MHIDEENIRMFSRNCHEVTDLYGPALTEYLRDSLKAKAAILDGEVVVIDKHTLRAVPFGKNKQVAMEEAKFHMSQQATNSSQYQLCCSIPLPRLRFRHSVRERQ